MMTTTQDQIQQTSSHLSGANHWDHVLARCGFMRSSHRVRPGLYALGNPDSSSPVFVTANYTLSFDALRSSLANMDAYILVLDTQGINVWCAAGKGTFGTDELVKRIEVVKLAEVVSHRRLILPQLGAPGVAAHLVKQRTGFKVEYGPVRATDIPQYLRDGKASPEMRLVRFDLRDRLVLIPVEVVHLILPTFGAAVLTYFLGGWMLTIALILSVLGGVVLFPILLPWIPSQYFSSKGLILGWIVILPVVIAIFLTMQGAPWWRWLLYLPPYLMAFPALTSFISLNFTGSTTYTSRSGVRHEIFTFIPLMAWLMGISILLLVISVIIRIIGG